MPPNAANMLNVSNDSNAYVYPYFHAGSGTPLLYELVNEFGGLWFEGDASSSKLERLVRRIQSRCIVKPEEARWSDSCGDSALHRLVQIARFPSNTHLDTDLIVKVAHALCYPGATTALNKWKETPLHQFVVHCGMSDELISTENQPKLLEMSMELIRLLCKGNAASYRNYIGSLPLHDACEISQGYTLEKTFFTAASTRLRNNHPQDETLMRAQHAAIVQYLIRCHPSALFEGDNSGLTPLHRAVASWNCGAEIVSIIFKSAEQLIRYPGNHVSHASAGGYDNLSSLKDIVLKSPKRQHPLRPRECPLHLLWQHFCCSWRSGLPEKTISTIVLSTLNESNQQYPQQCSDPQMLVIQLGPLWEKTVLLLQGAYYGTLLASPQREDLLVHASISLRCPIAITVLAVRLYPEQLMQVDSAGRTPLAIAASLDLKNIITNNAMVMDSGDFVSQLSIEFWLPEAYRQAAVKLLRLLIHFDKRAAGVIDPSTGRLPLHTAIASGFEWDDCLRTIFEAEPRALSTRDAVTHLYPFSVAAIDTSCTMCSPVCNNDFGEESEGTASVTTIFELLRSDPSVLAFE